MAKPMRKTVALKTKPKIKSSSVVLVLVATITIVAVGIITSTILLPPIGQRANNGLADCVGIDKDGNPVDGGDYDPATQICCNLDGKNPYPKSKGNSTSCPTNTGIPGFIFNPKPTSDGLCASLVTQQMKDFIKKLSDAGCTGVITATDNGCHSSKKSNHNKNKAIDIGKLNCPKKPKECVDEGNHHHCNLTSANNVSSNKGTNTSSINFSYYVPTGDAGTDIDDITGQTTTGFSSFNVSLSSVIIRYSSLSTANPYTATAYPTIVLTEDYGFQATTTINNLPAGTPFSYQIVTNPGRENEMVSESYNFSTPAQSVSITQPTSTTPVAPGVSLQVNWAGVGFLDNETGFLYLYKAANNSMVYNPYQDYINRNMVINGWNLYSKGGSFNPTLRKDLAAGSYKFVFKKSNNTIVGESQTFEVQPLFSDGGFESGVGSWTNWQGTASISRDTTTFKSGTASLKWADNDTGVNNTSSYRDFINATILRGRTININFWYKITGMNYESSAPLLIILDRNGTGGGWVNLVSKRYLVPDWSYVSQNVKIPSDATYVRLMIYKGNWYTTATVNIDDFKIEAVNAVCGNAKLETGEVCDDGSTYNGQVGRCNKYCSNREPIKITIQAESADRLSDASTTSFTGAVGTVVSFNPTQYIYGFAQIPWPGLLNTEYHIWTRQYRPTPSDRRLCLYKSDHSVCYGWKQAFFKDRWEWVYQGKFTAATFTSATNGNKIIVKGNGSGSNLYLDQLILADGPDYDPQYPR
ncbi:MAG: hypothetical protein M1338_04295 [Patescibacteria group bacterium]|nr:hypothetical protein [Patescibacteria group bacterium]